MPISNKHFPAIFALIKTLLHLFTAQTLGLHRDELLYLTLGKHIDWGYWSNPPLIGMISWMTQHTLGDSVLGCVFCRRYAVVRFFGLSSAWYRNWAKHS
jgi:hypothetical protein